MDINKRVKKKRKTKQEIINQLRKEIINNNDKYELKIEEEHKKMIAYKKNIEKFVCFHDNIIGCLDKIDEIRMEKIMENMTK